MESMKTADLKNADFVLYRNNPIIKPFDKTFVVADPSVLTPDNSHDKKWHMFFHTNFGVYHFESEDGIKFKKRAKLLSRAMRPNINYIDGRYYLYYERTAPFLVNMLNLANICKWHSEIYLCESDDLVSWTKPKKVVGFSKDFEKSDRGISLSNPYLLKTESGYRLYYSCGLTFIDDCGFCEPTYITYAESDRPNGGFVSAEKPIIEPDKNSRFLNLCSGCLKVYKLADGYVGIQNGIYLEDGISKSAILMLTSKDGKSFTFEKSLLEPHISYSSDWMKQFVYASHMVEHDGLLRLYFNARDTSNIIKGRECIGFMQAKINGKSK